MRVIVRTPLRFLMPVLAGIALSVAAVGVFVLAPGWLAQHGYDPFYLNMAKDAAYDSRDEVVADGAINRGWIPEWLPPSAAGIWESHNLDTNRSWLTFVYDPRERPRMEAACRPVDAQEAQFPKRDPRRAWWPDDLTRGSPSVGNGYELYVCSEVRGGPAYMALRRDAPRAWFWRTSY